MTFNDFEIKYISEVIDNRGKDIRKGQALMNFLADVWHEEYKRMSSIDYYPRTDIDCFYNDRLIPNALKHLKHVWNEHPDEIKAFKTN